MVTIQHFSPPFLNRLETAANRRRGSTAQAEMEHVNAQAEQRGAHRPRPAARRLIRRFVRTERRGSQSRHPRIRQRRRQPQPVRALRIPCPTSLPFPPSALQVPKHQPYPHANPILPALRLRAARRRTPRLRAVAVPQALRPALYPAGLLERPRPATPRHPRRVRQRCILRSTAAGFSANDSFLSAALRPHPSSLAIPTLKAASALDCGLDRCLMRFRISSFHWRNTVCWLTERPPLDFRYSNHGVTASSFSRG